MYYLLTESYKEQQRSLVKIILEATPADKIYLLGSTLMSRRTETVFMPDAPSCRYAGHYYLLVLVRDGTNCSAAQDKIENSCGCFVPVTAIVLYTRQFNSWLIQGHPFARIVNRFAILLNGPGGKEVIPVKEHDPEPLITADASVYNDGINKVTEFLAGAGLYLLRKQYNMAAFMLHQAAEQALHAIFKIKTGLHLNTHNTGKLLRYCSLVSYKLPEVFPVSNEEDKRLFGLLQKAYADSRYKMDYHISFEDLQLLKERVEKLRMLLEEIGRSLQIAEI